MVFKKGMKPWNKGKKHSWNTKEKMRRVRKGKTFEEIFGEERARELKRKIKETTIGEKNPFYGKHHTEKTKEILRNQRVGRKLDITHRKNISKSLMGHEGWNKKYHTVEQRKIGELESKKRWKGNNLEKDRKSKKMWKEKNINYGKKYRKKNENKIKDYEEKKRKKLKLIENKRRKKLRLPLIGEGFKKEMQLLVYIHSLFQNYNILTHHRKTLGDWGYQGLELDIYIPKLRLAFEYMGEQHYEWLAFFHKTQEVFEYQQYRDRCKKRLCKLKGITLIKIKYNEILSEQLILSKLKYANFGNKKILNCIRLNKKQ